MLSIKFPRLPRQRKPVRTNRDWSTTWTSRDWSDLPVHHPVDDTRP